VDLSPAESLITRAIDVSPESDAFIRLVAAVRAVQNEMPAARPSAGDAADMVKALEAVAAQLSLASTTENSRLYSRRWDIPGRSQLLVPTYDWTVAGAGAGIARVTFERFYGGVKDVAHGGALSLFFDDVLGRVCNDVGQKRSRTAHLSVDYRATVPLDTELVFECRIDRVEGRKRFCTGTLTQGDRLLAEASALFVVLKPGQR
jgi:acyl-coenzyme A thioesterase PaaI-like protein